MRAATYFTRMMFLFIYCICSFSCIGPIPIDVVMIDNELFFVLEEEHEISSLRVIVATDRKKMGTSEYMWLLDHDPTTKVEERQYPRLKQIKYGQKFDAFPVIEGPVPLQQNVEYAILIKMGDKFARETFIITGENKVIMPKPAFIRQKNRTYSVSIDRDGNKKLMLDPVSK